MHVISIKPFHEAAKKYPNRRLAIMDAYRVLRKANFKSPDEMRKVFPSLGNFKYEDKWWIVDIGGNKLRLIAFIQFMHNRMYVKHIFSHGSN
ncbi:unnamed protein product [marine sediment metagenome]|uniref:mRNA interferase HigB n=1 Tax=marine sediment metagenome TaxID=412755 RepID=X1DVM7_9ZZZZ